MNEKWAEIDGYQGKYYISNFGRLKGPKCIRSLQHDKNGYLVTMIKGKNVKIHRLVGLYFIYNNNPGEFNQINHLDGNKANNHYTNLEWTNSHFNHLHAYRTGLRACPKGEASPTAKLTEQDILRIRQLLGMGFIHKEIAKMFGICRSSVSHIATGHSWSHVLKSDN